MQLYMKPLNILVFIFTTFFSCGQTVTSDKQQTSGKPLSREALTIYQSMTGEICNCTSGTMKNNKPSTTFDSCYKIVLNKYTDTLKALGYDPASSIGQNKLSNEICRDLYQLMQKEWADKDANKLLFKGTIASQKELSNGEIEIVMVNSTTKEKRTFKSKSFLSNPLETNKNTLSYEMTVEYEVRQNPKTKRDEYFIKEGGKTMTIEARKVK